MTQDEFDEVAADISEVAGAMIEKSIERGGLQMKEHTTIHDIAAQVHHWLQENTEPAT